MLLRFLKWKRDNRVKLKILFYVDIIYILTKNIDFHHLILNTWHILDNKMTKKHQINIYVATIIYLSIRWLLDSKSSTIPNGLKRYSTGAVLVVHIVLVNPNYYILPPLRIFTLKITISILDTKNSQKSVTNRDILLGLVNISQSPYRYFTLK